MCFGFCFHNLLCSLAYGHFVGVELLGILVGLFWSLIVLDLANGSGPILNVRFNSLQL